MYIFVFLCPFICNGFLSVNNIYYKERIKYSGIINDILLKKIKLKKRSFNGNEFRLLYLVLYTKMNLKFILLYIKI